VTRKKKTTPAPRRIELVPLDEVQEAAANPKRHHSDLGASIGRFGFADAPILDERTGRLVAGHGRLGQLRAMQERGETPPEGITQDERGVWLVPLQRGWSSRSDEEAAAFLVAHNRIGEAGGWDDEELAELLGGLGEAAVGLGISDVYLADLLAEHVEPDAPGGFPELDEGRLETDHTCPKCGYGF
jgi:hypothetical protein